MVMGRPISTKEALDWKVIHQVYTDDIHLKKMLMVYGMEYSKRGANRELIRTLKSKMHAETLRVCEGLCFSPLESINFSIAYK